MSITISGDGDINATGNDIELNSTGTTDVTLALGGGSVGIGTANPNGKLAIASTGNTGSSLEAYSATDSIIPDFQLLKSGSGTIGTLSTTANGEALGQIRFTGIDTANNQRDGAKISVYQDSAATSGTVPAGIRFDTTGSERLRIDNDGLKFNGDTAAANALDDYEEGTWTPAVTFGGGNTGLTYNTGAGGTQGAYVKVGQLVYASFAINISSKGSSTGALSISGLPFNTINTYYNEVGGFLHRYEALLNINGAISTYVNNGPNLLLFMPNGSGTSSDSTTQLQSSNVNTNARMWGTIIYRTTS